MTHINDFSCKSLFMYMWVNHVAKKKTRTMSFVQQRRERSNKFTKLNNAIACGSSSEWQSWVCLYAVLRCAVEYTNSILNGITGSVHNVNITLWCWFTCAPSGIESFKTNRNRKIKSNEKRKRMLGKLMLYAKKIASDSYNFNDTMFKITFFCSRWPSVQ